MLYWTVVFFTIAVVAALFGFSGITNAESAWIDGSFGFGFLALGVWSYISARPARLD